MCVHMRPCMLNVHRPDGIDAMLQKDDGSCQDLPSSDQARDIHHKLVVVRGTQGPMRLWPE